MRRLQWYKRGAAYARYNIGVTKVADNWDHYNNVIQITVGYKFAL